MGEAQSKESKKMKEKNEDSLLPLWIGLGIGGGALVSIIAAPFVIAGIGFGAGGVAAGSLAAAWMSASGPVAAGSLIAILQSIGAAGMGAASVGVAAAAGGVVGGGIATGVSLAVMNKSDEDDEEKSSNLEENKTILFNNSNSYKSKAEKLKRLFKDLPADEWLIADYSCSLVDEILIQGRLFLTTSHLCFYSNVDGKEISKLINCRDITDITKKSHSSGILQFHVIADAGKYVFANFDACDKSYDLLLSIWKKSSTKEVTNPVELIKTITDNYGMNLGFRDTKEVMAYFDPFQKVISS